MDDNPLTGPRRGAAPHAAPPEDILAEMFALVASRAGLSRAAQLLDGGLAAMPDAVSAAVRMYSAVASQCPALEPAALDVLAPLTPRVLNDSAALRLLVRDEPVTAGLEDACALVAEELHDLIAAFAPPTPWPGEPGGPYQTACAEDAALRAATAEARPIWRVLRQALVARGKPPARWRPATVLADNAEYYIRDAQAPKP